MKKPQKSIRYLLDVLTRGVKKQEITCSEIDHYLMLDEDSLLRCIERHTQLSLTEKELEKRKERLIKESEEEIFLLQSMKELTMR